MSSRLKAVETQLAVASGLEEDLPIDQRNARMAGRVRPCLDDGTDGAVGGG